MDTASPPHDQAALKAIRELPSYRSEMIAVKVGKRIDLTTDAVTACGNVNFVNKDLKQLEKDYDAFHEIVGRSIFTIE